MLKKAPNIPLSLHLEFVDSTQNMNLVVPQHTILKQIEVDIAKRLKINPFKIQMTFQNSGVKGFLNPTSTLYQNSIKNRDTLFVKILNIQTRSQAKNAESKGKSDQKNMTLLDIVSGRPVKIENVVKGLNLNVTCTNKRCFNYGKNIIMQFGLGSFDYFALSNSIKCPICPDKEINMSPTCQVKDFVFSDCLWTLEGTILSKNIELGHKLKDWMLVKTSDSVEFKKIFSQNQWTRATIVVKEIGRTKQSIPLLL